MGQDRRICHVGSTSAKPPKASGKADIGKGDAQSRLSALWPARSDVDLLGYRQSIVDIDAQIPHRALNLRMTEQELNGPEIACATVNQGRLRPPQRVCTVDVRIEPMSTSQSDKRRAYWRVVMLCPRRRPLNR
jgi:hypothetical protein